MKTLPSGLAAHVALGTTTLAWLLLITRSDDTVYAFTSASDDIVIDGVTYGASQGLDISGIVMSAGFAVSNLELTTLDDGTVFSRADVLAGRWRNAAFEISRCNYAAPGDGVEPIMGGTLGVARIHNGHVVIELRGLQQMLQQPIGKVVSKSCRAQLGDAQCTVDLGPLTHTGTLTEVTSRGQFKDDASGGDEFFDEVALLMHCEGTHTGTVFTDSSSYAHTLTKSGNLTTNNAWASQGTTSMNSDGSGYINALTHAAFAFGTGDCAFQFVVKPGFAATMHLINWGSNPEAANGGRITLNSSVSKIQLALGGSVAINGPSWGSGGVYEITVSRTAGVWSMWVNNTLAGTASNSQDIDEGQINISGRPDGSGKLIGAMDEIRITGAARDGSAPQVEAWEDHGESFTAEWFAEGVFTFTSGANSGLSQKVKSYTGAGTYTLSLPMVLPVAVGDTYSVVAGCRKRMEEDCIAKFDNVLNFDAEPHVPGQDEMTKPV